MRGVKLPSEVGVCTDETGEGSGKHVWEKQVISTPSMAPRKMLLLVLLSSGLTSLILFTLVRPPPLPLPEFMSIKQSPWLEFGADGQCVSICCLARTCPDGSPFFLSPSSSSPPWQNSHRPKRKPPPLSCPPCTPPSPPPPASFPTHLRLLLRSGPSPSRFILSLVYWPTANVDGWR